MGNHVDVAAKSLFGTPPINDIVVVGSSIITISVVDQNIAAPGTIVPDAIPVVQGADALLIGRQSTANILWPFTLGFGQEALVTKISQVARIEFT